MLPQKASCSASGGTPLSDLLRLMALSTASKAAFLDQLKRVLGLDDAEADSERDNILAADFIARARPLMSRSDVTSEEVRSEISRLARHLRISPDQQKELLKPLAQAAFDSIRN